MIDLRNSLWKPDKASSDIISNVGIATSPFTGGTQVVELPGAYWKLTFTYSNMAVEYGRKMKAIKSMCRGGAEAAHIVDLSYTPRRSAEPGAPIVDGANQVGDVLKISGLTPNRPVYEIGDQLSYLSVDGCHRMHMVVGDATADNSGRASVKISPPLRNAPVNAGAVNSIAPELTARLSDGGSVNIDGMLCSQSLTFSEHLYGLL